MISTDRHENRYERIRTVEATLTRRSNFKNRKRAMKSPVMKMEMCGVLNRSLILPKHSGRRLSLDRASGYLDADIIPAFAVDMNARNCGRAEEYHAPGPEKGKCTVGNRSERIIKLC